jgi:hypothetical protein
VLLFSFFKEIGSGGHTNSHGHPQFLNPLAIRSKSALGGSSKAGTNLGVCASPLRTAEGLALARFPSTE